VEKDRLMASTPDIVAKLWSLCHVLRDDGVTYNEYVTELTFLLFLKMLEETGKENRLPKQYRWSELAKREGLDQLDYYRRLLLDLGQPTIKDGLVRAIFTDAQTRLRKPTNLKALTSSIDQLDWFSAREEGLGTLYEGLLEKNASDKKSGAGQYFTPRPLIDCIVRLMQPQAGETVQDPAAGTAGFLVAADRYIKDRTDDLFKLTEQKAFFQRHNAFVGAELVPDTHRLCMMNLLLHGIEGGVELVDTLSPDGERLSKAELVLTNPPFGTKKGGGRPTRSDFSVTADTSNSVPELLSPYFPAEVRGLPFFRLIEKISSGAFSGKQVDWGGWAAKVSKQDILDFIAEVYCGQEWYADPKVMPHLFESMQTLMAYVRSLPEDGTFALVATEL
jgi:type I restriction enzyme M protein